MKSILLPIDQSEQMPAVLETARLLANLFEATIEGVALRPAFAEIVAPDPIVAVTIPPADWNETEFCRSVRQTFDAFAARHSADASKGARFRWRGGSAIEDGALGSLGRVYDVTVLGRPGGRGARMTALEAALVRQRPAGPDGAAGCAEDIRRNGPHSLERQHRDGALHAVCHAAVEESQAGVADRCRRGDRPRGRASRMRSAIWTPTASKRPTRRSRQAARAPARPFSPRLPSIGADLLIKGAYTQSRLRQMIFGGATSHILAAAELPVFFAH